MTEEKKKKEQKESETAPKTSPETSAQKTPGPNLPRLEDLKMDPVTTSMTKVFVSSGTDQIFPKQVMALLREFGLQVVSIRSLDEEGKTLGQKLIENPDVGYAIVILSAEEFTYAKKGKPADAVLRSTQQPVYEMGFLIGALGRDRVYVLCNDQRSFRTPTEFFEALYIPLDKHNLWEKELISRLKSCGFTVKEKPGI